MEPFNPPRRTEKQGFSTAATTSAETILGDDTLSKSQKISKKLSFLDDESSDGEDAQRYEDLEAEEDNRYAVRRQTFLWYTFKCPH